MFYKTIIISDLHLGSPDAKFKELISFLKSNTCENLILNGDIVDTRYLKIFNGRKKEYEDFLNFILNLKNTKITYIIGNHEDFYKQTPIIKNIKFQNHIIYQSNKKKYFICHGHQFDKVETKLRGFTYITFVIGTFLYWINRQINLLTIHFNISYFSIVKPIKRFIKTIMLGGTKQYKKNLYQTAKKNKCDGIICGHTHKPQDKMIRNIHYLNSGDWTEHLTAIVENKSGFFKILYYK